MSDISLKGVDLQLKRCTDARNAINDAKRVYDAIGILVDQAAAASDIAKATVDAMIAAAETQILSKEQTALDVLDGVGELLTSIESFPSDVDGLSPLEICESARRKINVAATKADILKSRAQQAADLSTISDAALATAQSVWSDKKRLYENAVTAATAAQGDIIAMARG